MNLPFKMRTETRMEKYRAETFFTKEPETLMWIRSFHPRDVFFDVGANVGVYSLYAASLFPEMRIVAFEPMTENFKALLANRDMNGFTGVICLYYAVGSYDGYVDISESEQEAGKSGAQAIHDTPSLACVLVTIDNLVEYPKPTHVKIDIDGQELEVIKGMQNTLPHIKSCLIEVSKASRGPIVDIMTAAGFHTDNRFNTMTPHSRERRAAEGIDAENIVFTR